MEYRYSNGDQSGQRNGDGFFPKNFILNFGNEYNTAMIFSWTVLSWHDMPNTVAKERECFDEVRGK
jgi:hypothetical protein